MNKGYRWRSIALLKALSDTPSSYSTITHHFHCLSCHWTRKRRRLSYNTCTLERTYNIQRTTLYVLLNPFCARFCSHLARVTMRMGTSSSGSAIATGAATASALPATCCGRVRKHHAQASHEQHADSRWPLPFRARQEQAASAGVGRPWARGRSSSQDATVRFPQALSRWSGSSSSAVRTVSRAASREGTSLRRPLEQPDDERADAGPPARP